MHQGHHELTYIVFSVVVAVLGSWTALDLQRQVRAHTGRIRSLWLAATAISMGLSIFSMHFIAMLGFDADMPISYDLWPTLCSLLLAISATWLAFAAVSSAAPSLLRIGAAGIAMGAGIGLMHYLGMAAMRVPATLSYDPLWVTASFGIAIVASWAALIAVFKRPNVQLRLLGSLVLGAAIASMHYTAMAAASFEPARDALLGTGELDQLRLAFGVGAGTMALLFFALMSAMFDRRFEALALKEASAVAAREARFREVLKRLPLAVVVAPLNGSEISFANEWGIELFGDVHPCELRFFELEGTEIEPLEHPFREAMNGGGSFSGRLVSFRKGDELRYLELSAAQLHGLAAEAGDVVLMAQDVTLRLEAEQTLQQAAKLETIGQLTGGVAHDFNNLLTPIVGGLEMISRESGLSERGRRIVDGASQAATKAATLVQRLLAFARRQVLVAKVVDMGAVLGGIRDLIQRSIGPTIQVEVSAAQGLMARLDAGQFELAILNLAVNARDSMPNGGVLRIHADRQGIEADVVPGLAAGEYVRVSVTDTGCGMDPATLKRAVEPFFSTKGDKGTGLGLSMVHGLAAQSNGALRLSSEAGRGTRAELWLPVSEEGAEEITEEGPVTMAGAGPATILLVDDEELVRRAVAEMLKEANYEVVQASSGSEALRLLEEDETVAAVVTDQIMPGMTGASLANEIAHRRLGVPVLIITGYTNPTDLSTTVPTLRKPFQTDQLASAVAKLLRARGDNILPLRRRGVPKP